MAEVIAIGEGYFGKQRREYGDRFEVPDEIMDDPARRPSWVERAAGSAIVSNELASAPAGGAKPKPKPKPEPEKPKPEANGVADALGPAPDWFPPDAGVSK